MNWESSTERSVRRAKPACPICAKSDKRDYPAELTCNLCGYQGAWPYRIPDTTKADALEASLLDRSRFAQERRKKPRLNKGTVPADWLPVREPAMSDAVFTALYELGWLRYAAPLDPVHMQFYQPGLFKL